MSTSAKKSSTESRLNHDVHDPISLGQSMADIYTKAMPVFQKFAENYYTQNHGTSLDPLNITKSYVDYLSNASMHPEEFWQRQTDFWNEWNNLAMQSARKALGEESVQTIVPSKGDRRFKADEWDESAVFDFIKQSYLLTCEWMQKETAQVEGLSDEEQQKLSFYTRLLSEALSPTNFALTNPEVLRETIDTGGQNLIKGFENLLEDMKQGRGDFQVKTTSLSSFELGKNIATTPGRVIYQNDLMQLIQYVPTTDKVFKRPMLIVPPWINKYYILDLGEGNSYVQWLVAQGHSVFMISWVNPDKKLGHKRFDDYMQEGVLDALTQIEKSTGEKSCNAIGYCIGGTLLNATLAYLETTKQGDKIASATCLTTLLDFKHVGELKIFLDEEQFENINKTMQETGIFDGKQLQKAFSLLRANDLIWSFVVNNYLMGKSPFPFDLLYWNNDSSNLPAEMQRFCLQQLYQENALIKANGVSMKGANIDLRKIKTPRYFLSTRDDHIAPWKSTYDGAQLSAGPVTFTLGASGHIAGVVNPPAKNKYAYWSSDELPKNANTWLTNAKEHEGSWWVHWQQWVEGFTGEKVQPRKVPKGIEDAPGSYVKVRC